MKHLTATNSTTTGSNNSRRASRTHLTIAAAAIAALSFSSCSSLIERATEKAVEEGVERAIEADSGENVELDFDVDSGSISIETEDGSFSVDGEDGTFVLETEDGTFEGSGDENGFEVTNEDGETVVNADFDPDGDSENAQIEITTDDGSFVAGNGAEAWELWPSEIARPDLGGDVTVTGQTFNDGGLWLLAAGDVDGTAEEALTEFTDRLGGFTATEQGTSADSVWVNMTNGNYDLSIVADGTSDSTVLSMTVSTSY